jgi:hypothetical protein
MTMLAPQLLFPRDRRQSPAARALCRGVCRLLRDHAFAVVSEVQLANGRRADVVGLSDRGRVWIVEIKSSVEDYRSDQKWPLYRDFCDGLFFCVAADFPRELLPRDCGLIIADRYGGEIVRPAPEHKLAAARRKSMMLLLARTAAQRLEAAIDPQGVQAAPTGERGRALAGARRKAPCRRRMPVVV